MASEKKITGGEQMSERWKLNHTKWVTGIDWYTVIDTKHEHNSYETPDLQIAKAFKKMMESIGD
jgi:hypothetical protein